MERWLLDHKINECLKCKVQETAYPTYNKTSNKGYQQKGGTIIYTKHCSIHCLPQTGDQAGAVDIHV